MTLLAKQTKRSGAFAAAFLLGACSIAPLAPSPPGLTATSAPSASESTASSQAAATVMAWELQPPPLQVLGAEYLCPVSGCSAGSYYVYRVDFENRREAMADHVAFKVCLSHHGSEWRRPPGGTHVQDCWTDVLEQPVPAASSVSGLGSATFTTIFLPERFMTVAVRYVHYTDGVSWGVLEPSTVSWDQKPSSGGVRRY